MAGTNWRGNLQSHLYGWDPSVDSGIMDMADVWKPIAVVQDPSNSGQFLLRTDIEFVMDSGVDANIARIAGHLTDSNVGTAGDGTLRVVEASDGSLMTRLGATGDAASATGTQSAQLRSMAESLAALSSDSDNLESVINGEDSPVTNSGVMIMAESRTGQKAAMSATGDASRIVTDEYGQLVEAVMSWATRANRVTEIDPINERAVVDVLEDDTNLAADTYYYPSSDGASLDGFADATWQVELAGGVTCDLEADLDDAAGATWIPITQAGLNLLDNTTGNAQIVDSGVIMHYERLNVSRIRAKVTTADATNSVKVVLRRSYN